jgi:hypothetical protein
MVPFIFCSFLVCFYAEQTILKIMERVAFGRVTTFEKPRIRFCNKIQAGKNPITGNQN